MINNITYYIIICYSSSSITAKYTATQNRAARQRVIQLREKEKNSTVMLNSIPADGCVSFTFKTNSKKIKCTLCGNFTNLKKILLVVEQQR